jgi:RHS repeat-associated protein
MVAEMAYDGLNRRTKQWTPSDERHYYYNAAWQVVQVDMWSGEGPTVSVHKQYVWDLRYIDAPIFMDLDTNQQAGFEDRYYYTTDANMNVTALVAESGGNVVERYRYDPYGAVTIMDNSFSGRTSSSYDNVILFAGYHYDPATGLNYARNRYYTSLLGLWPTTDPGGDCRWRSVPGRSRRLHGGTDCRAKRRA